MQRKPKKSDSERFCEAFRQRYGAWPGELLQRKLAAGAGRAQLQAVYDQLAADTARRCRCKPLSFDEALRGTPDGRKERNYNV